MAKQVATQAKLVRPGTYSAFMPVIDTKLVVNLPGETMRCPVKKIVSPDAVLVTIDSVPMAKSHSFRLNDTVGVRRRLREGRDVWEAQTDRDFLAEQALLVKPVERVAKKPAPKKAVKGRSK